MSRRTWVIVIAVLLAGAGGVAFAIWYTNQRNADGQLNVLLDRSGAPRAPTVRGEVPVGAQQTMAYLDNQYVVAAQATPPNPARISEILRLIRALQARYPGIQTTLQGI